jgi:hypothetical protein
MKATLELGSFLSKSLCKSVELFLYLYFNMQDFHNNIWQTHIHVVLERISSHLTLLVAYD